VEDVIEHTSESEYGPQATKLLLAQPLNPIQKLELQVLHSEKVVEANRQEVSDE
jgi:hypothetical protein